MNNKVVIVKPNHLAGRVATKNGDLFRYPSQNFWVQPVILENGHKTLALEVKDFPMDDSIQLPKGDKIKLNLDPTIVYDYQTLLQNSVCPSCGQCSNWQLPTHPDSSDIFCVFQCCGMIYSMIPESVRVIAVPTAIKLKKVNEFIPDNESCDDAEFFKALEELF